MISNYKGASIKALVMDLDGTLLDNSKCISPYSQKVLRQCKNSGILLGIATARSIYQGRCFAKQIGADIILCDNGAYMECGGKCVLSNTINAQTSSALINMLLAHDEIVGTITMESLIEYKVIKNGFLSGAVSWNGKIEIDTYKITAEIFVPQYVRYLESEFPQCKIIPFREKNWYRFSDRNACKGQIVNYLIGKVGLLKENIVAFGDDLNDLDMIKKAGHSVAMGNAIKEIQMVADDICDDNNHNGVANYIVKHLIEGTMTIENT